MAKVYISGPISYNPTYRRDFMEAELRLLALGHEVVNPVTITEHLLQLDLSGQELWERCMEVDLAALADCDMLALLDGRGIWSRGSDIEVAEAHRLGIPVVRLDALASPYGGSGQAGINPDKEEEAMAQEEFDQISEYERKEQEFQEKLGVSDADYEAYRRVQRYHYIMDSFSWCWEEGVECTDSLAEAMADILMDDFDLELTYWGNFQKAYDECTGGDHADADKG